MKKRSVLLVLAVLLTLAVAASPVLASGRPDRVAGEITGLDATSGEITLQLRHGAEIAVATSDTTEFYRKVHLGGLEAISFDDLAIGDRVQVVGTRDGEVLTAAKVILVPPPPPPPQAVHGSIVALDAGAGTIRVQPCDGDALTVQTTAETTFYRRFHRGRLEPISFADLAVEDQVTVLGTWEGDLFIAGRVTVMPAAPPELPRLVNGDISALDPAGAFTLERRLGGAITVKTTTETQFYRQARWGRLEPITFAELVVGDRVSVLGTWDGEALNASKVIVMRSREGETEGTGSLQMLQP
jgi:hypothetical protein